MVSRAPQAASGTAARKKDSSASLRGIILRSLDHHHDADGDVDDDEHDDDEDASICNHCKVAYQQFLC